MTRRGATYEREALVEIDRLPIERHAEQPETARMRVDDPDAHRNARHKTEIMCGRRGQPANPIRPIWRTRVPIL